MKHNNLYKLYASGFILSLIFTVSAYHLVVTQILTGGLLIASILILAGAQLIVQLFFFLHLGSEEKPRLNLISLISAIGIILLIVVASIWIMSHLNYNMSPQQMDQFVIKDEGIHK